MAVMLSDLIEDSRDQFQTKLIAGADGVDVPVNWVHLIEDAAVAKSFWGGELVMTTGVAQQGTAWLLDLLKTLHQYGSSGAVINTGPYIRSVPQEAIDFCNQVNLPLLTMPWHVSLSEVIKFYCMRIMLDNQSDDEIGRAIINAIQAPMDESRYLPVLQDYYDTDGIFQVVAFRADYPEEADSSARMRTTDVVRTLLRRTLRKFTLLRYDDYFVMVFNNPDEGQADAIIEQLIRRCAIREPPLPVHVGVGDPVEGVRRLRHSFQRARAASRMADYYRKDLIYFRDMGINQLMFMAEDPAVLETFCHDNLAVLEEYDREHNASLVETLYYDLRTGGSIKAIAEATWAHRNTVSYRLNKIRELLNVDLNDADERTRLRMAFYARDILQHMHEVHG